MSERLNESVNLEPEPFTEKKDYYPERYDQNAVDDAKAIFERISGSDRFIEIWTEMTKMHDIVDSTKYLMYHIVQGSGVSRADLDGKIGWDTPDGEIAAFMKGLMSKYF